MMNLREQLAERALAQGGKKKPNGVIEFRCHRHSDRKASAWLGDHAWGCASCGFEENLYSLAKDLGVELPNRDYTIEDLAAAKGFNADKLREWGLRTQHTDKGSVVAIPYIAADGKILRTKYRAGQKMWWAEGEGIYPYGLHKLNGKPAVILCEGETDTIACWHHDVQALGFPGANTWRREFLEYLHGKEIYIWQEPDQGGETFVRAITQDIPTAKVITAPPDVKDLADLHRLHGKEFKTVLRQLIVDAKPAGVAQPVVPFDVFLGSELRSLFEQKLKPVDAVPTPWPSWSNACRDDGGGVGLARSWHIVMAGTPGAGKTTLAANMAWRAMLAGERVTYVTLEMAKQQLQTRLLSVISGVPVRQLESGGAFNKAAFQEAERRIHEIHENTGGLVSINRRPLHRLQDVVDSIRYNHEVYGSRYFIVDYLQLAWVGNANDIYNKIVEVSHAVNSLAKDLGIVSVGLSQYNRETSKDKAARPSKHGLMGGSSLENDADQVILLWRNGDETLSERMMTAIIDKNRHGPEPDIDVRFNLENLRIEERRPDETSSWKISK